MVGEIYEPLMILQKMHAAIFVVVLWKSKIKGVSGKGEIDPLSVTCDAAIRLPISERLYKSQQSCSRALIMYGYRMLSLF